MEFWSLEPSTIELPAVSRGVKQNGVLAAIDIGTNSFHMVIARPGKSGTFEIVVREKEVVRLGSGSSDMKHLKDDAIARGVAALRRFRELAESYDAEVRAVATSAVREAQNQDEFLERALEEAGVKVEIVSGLEEARLIYLGALQGLPIFDRQVLLIDIGGGSTEILIGRAAEVLFSSSLKLGAIRLTDRFFGNKEKITAQDVEDCRQFVRSTLQPMIRDMGGQTFEMAVGCSGTITNVDEIVRAFRDEPPLAENGDGGFNRVELDEVIHRLVLADTTEKRLKLGGIDPKRADIILGGAIIVEQIFQELRLHSLRTSKYALREGVLLDALEDRFQGGVTGHLNDLRYRAVLRLAEACHYEEGHARHVMQLSLQLFDQLKDAHGLDERNREYLEAAALLHNVGLSISRAKHHLHSSYIIRNSDFLTGFTLREVELIAETARYHRKSMPKRKHPEFAALRPEDQQVVKVLCAILRIAVALERTHTRAVRALHCKRDDRRLIIQVEPSDGARPILEVVTARLRRELLERCLGVVIDFEVSEGCLASG